MITHVAIRTSTRIWTLPRPFRHHHILRLMQAVAELKGVTISRRTSPRDQGFVTDTGQFLEREPALQYAQEHGQYMSDEAYCARHRQDQRPHLRQLFSEDLW